MVETGQGRQEPFACESEQTSELRRRHRPTLQWSNIEKHLKKAERATIEAKSLFDAMKYAENISIATTHADALAAHLKRQNLSAMKSFEEARDDLLMIHRLNLGADLRRTFSTTNPIESLNSISEEDMRRVKRWKNSGHFQRWCATMALNAETRMNRVRGHRGLAALRQRLLGLCNPIAVDRMKTAA